MIKESQKMGKTIIEEVVSEPLNTTDSVQDETQQDSVIMKEIEAMTIEESIQDEDNTATDNTLESELTSSINQLMDRIEENDDLKHILTDREENKIISQSTLDKLRAKIAYQEAPFEAYDGTLRNLLDLAKDHDVIATAIEANPERMLERFQDIRLRYALVKEKPERLASLIHYQFSISMAEIEKENNEDQKRVDAENEELRKTRKGRKYLKVHGRKHSYGFSNHNMNAHTLQADISSQSKNELCSCHGEVIYQRDAVYFKSDKKSLFRAARFDKFGKIEISALTENDAEIIQSFGHKI